MKCKEHLTGIILAGGKSSRMGTDKGFVMWKDKPFVQHSIDALQPIVDEIIIISGDPKYDMLGYKRIEDIFPEAGPLSGLHSGLKESRTQLNLVLSCDVPLISTEILEELVASYKKSYNAVVCSANDKIMPLVGLYHKNCCHVCELLLQMGERKMMVLLDELEIIQYLALSKEQSESVKNINSVKDLNEIKDAS